MKDWGAHYALVFIEKLIFFFILFYSNCLVIWSDFWSNFFYAFLFSRIWDLHLKEVMNVKIVFLWFLMSLKVKPVLFMNLRTLITTFNLTQYCKFNLLALVKVLVFNLIFILDFHFIWNLHQMSVQHLIFVDNFWWDLHF